MKKIIKRTFHALLISILIPFVILTIIYLIGCFVKFEILKIPTIHWDILRLFCLFIFVVIFILNSEIE